MNLSARIATIAAAFSFYLSPARSVESITASLESTLGQLYTAQERHNARAQVAEEKAVKLVRRAIAKRAEANRAGRVASRLSDLLS